MDSVKFVLEVPSSKTLTGALLFCGGRYYCVTVDPFGGVSIRWGASIRDVTVCIYDSIWFLDEEDVTLTLFTTGLSYGTKLSQSFYSFDILCNIFSCNILNNIFAIPILTQLSWFFYHNFHLSTLCFLPCHFKRSLSCSYLDWWWKWYFPFIPYHDGHFGKTTYQWLRARL